MGQFQLARRLLALALTAAITTPLFAQDSVTGLRSGITGTWRVDGLSDDRGSVHGELRFDPGTQVDQWRYRLELQFDRGGLEVDSGLATIIGDRLELDGRTAQAASRGLVLSRMGQSLVMHGARLEASVPRGWLRLEQRDEAQSRLSPLIDGRVAFPEIRAALLAARETIHIQSYKWEDDSTGKSIADICKQKAAAGITVRILTDAIGSRSSKKLIESLRNGGCEVVVISPLLSGAKKLVTNAASSAWNALRGLFGAKPKAPVIDKDTILNRDHTKVIVLDGQLGFTGSMNIAEDHEHHFHDVHFRVEGALVPSMQRHFLDRWQRWGGAKPGNLAPLFQAQSAALGPPLPAKALRQLPGLFNDIKTALIRELDASQSHIFAETPYLLDDDVIDGFKRAARRGVDVKLILPNDKDHEVGPVRDAFLWIQDELQASGAAVYKYRSRFTHTKLTSTDSSWSCLGSSNLDWTSTRHNAEFNIEVFDPAFALRLERDVFGPDLANSDRAGKTQLGWFQKLKSGLFHIGRKFL